MPTPRFEKPLKFITHGHIFERSGYKLFHKCASLQAQDRAHWEQDLTLLLCALQSMLVAGLLCQWCVCAYNWACIQCCGMYLPIKQWNDDQWKKEYVDSMHWECEGVVVLQEVQVLVALPTEWVWYDTIPQWDAWVRRTTYYLSLETKYTVHSQTWGTSFCILFLVCLILRNVCPYKIYKIPRLFFFFSSY